MAVTTSAARRATGFRGPSASVLIRVAAASAALGIALSITDDYATLGKWFAVAGVLLLVAGLHRFGRLGPEPALHFEAPSPRKKKKKQKPSPG